MTRDEYIKSRNANEISIHLIYEYYQLRVTENVLSFDEFSKHFMQFFEICKPDFKELYYYYDVKFEVVSIVNTMKPGYPTIFI